MTAKKNPLDAWDRKILQKIQREFPLTHRPFLTLAEEFGLEEEEVRQRIIKLAREGFIRKVGPVLNSSLLGRSATLAAVKVPLDRVARVGAIISEYEGVSHNYLRQGRGVDVPFNVWFTLSAANETALKAALDEISHRVGLPVVALPTTKKFKIGVEFNIDVD